MDIGDELAYILPAERIKTKYIDLVSYASDAGFYYLVPKAVVQPNSEKEVIALFKFSRAKKIPLVFRTGGTSLSGQSITDGILVDLSQFWNRVTVEEAGDLVRVQPGVTGQMVNAHLKRFNRKIGPDPSSISAAMMGGILSNNASGMCCGVKMNSYHTTRGIRFILPDGNTFDTSNPQDHPRFAAECPELTDALNRIQVQITPGGHLYEKIRNKYETKNTVGYSLNAFIDYTAPLDILAHLLIGGEGTLAFIAEATLATVPDYPFKSTALIYFPDIYAACKSIIPLTEAGAFMVELMDRASLRAVESLAGMPESIRGLPEPAAALLVEFQENDPAALRNRVQAFLQSCDQLSLIGTPSFTEDVAEQQFFWKVRKGLFPAVGAVRASGTTVILEDLAFPVNQLGDAILDLQFLFKKYNYENAIIFGHAKDGNIHFVITQSFDLEEEVTRYDLFIREVVKLVTEKYNGSLKAEHGTGRNMAPFVETEWGSEAYEIMKKIKTAVDPEGLLNPGVIINADKQAHIKDLKPLPVVEEEVDKCIECGYCEHVCPSRNITTTPRRRIVVRRVLKNLKSRGEQEKYKLLLDQYQYDGLDTCAVDGLCATACPVDINTGDLVKRLRAENHSEKENRQAVWVAKHFKLVERTVRSALKAGYTLNRFLGKRTMSRLTGVMNKIISAIPVWTNEIYQTPNLGAYRQPSTVDRQTLSGIVYYPACITRMLGTYEGKNKNLIETFMSVCKKSGIQVHVVKDIQGSCCSQIYSSKGFREARSAAANDIVERLWEASLQGVLPVVTDVSSCAYTLHHLRPALEKENQERFDRMKIYDSIVFFHDHLPVNPNTEKKKVKVVVHPVCSLEKMKTGHKIISLAKRFAEEVDVPLHAGCCGMAGDRGFLFPELTDSATRPEATDVKAKNYDAYYSSTKTCEMAMSRAVSKNYESLLYLLDEVL